jgi:hypothetical protein
MATTGGAFAQTFSQWNGDTHSAVRDESNVYFNFTNWGIDLQTNAGDPDLYINNMTITGGAGYDALINMQTQVGGFQYNGSSSGTYTFGTAINGANNWNFAGAFHNGQVDAAVADGVYDFTLGIFGGATNTANSTLASYGLHVDIQQKLDINVAMTPNPSTIKEGGPGTEVSMTVTNNMTGRNFITHTWYVSGFGDGNGNFLAFDNFTGNWFDQTITPGGSHSDTHSTWHANLDTPIGTYTSLNGVVGGLDLGDEFFMKTDSQAVVTVLVPEPATFAVLGLGVLAFTKRRRAKK